MTQITYLKADEAPSKVHSKYTNFADIFSLKLAVELLKHMRINNHNIKLVDNWELPYGLIYSFGPMKLEIMKAFIENNLANDFIRSSKSSAKVLIFFNKKLNSSLRLCMDYQSVNNLTIKNQYPLFLIKKSLDWLGWACRFTQFNLTNAYH